MDLEAKALHLCIYTSVIGISLSNRITKKRSVVAKMNIEIAQQSIRGLHLFIIFVKDQRT